MTAAALLPSRRFLARFGGSPGLPRDEITPECAQLHKLAKSDTIDGHPYWMVAWVWASSMDAACDRLRNDDPFWLGGIVYLGVVWVQLGDVSRCRARDKIVTMRMQESLDA